jgi:hypothetical protein
VSGSYAGGGGSGYTRQEVAQRAGVDPEYLDRLVALGILTPAAADAFSPGDALRARWVQSLERAGVPLDGIAAAVRDGAFTLSYLDATAFDRFAGLSDTTFDQLSNSTGIRGSPTTPGPARWWSARRSSTRRAPHGCPSSRSVRWS